MSHTPGPWTLRRDALQKRPPDVFAGTTFVAAVAIGDHEFAEADARLIAAAPDMLAALKAIVEQIELLDNPSDMGVSAHAEEVDACRAAIAKAEADE